jgi:hypothetical protein
MSDTLTPAGARHLAEVACRVFMMIEVYREAFAPLPKQVSACATTGSAENRKD